MVSAIDFGALGRFAIGAFFTWVVAATVYAIIKSDNASVLTKIAVAVVIAAAVTAMDIILATKPGVWFQGD